MHIVHTLDKLAPGHGRGLTVVEFAQRQAQAGNEVTILGTEIDPALKQQAPSCTWACNETLRPHRDPTQLQPYRDWVVRQLRLIPTPDVINVHDCIDLWALGEADLSLPPVVYSAHSKPEYSLTQVPPELISQVLPRLSGLLSFGKGVEMALARSGSLPSNRELLFPFVQRPTGIGSHDLGSTPSIVCPARIDANKNQSLLLRALPTQLDRCPDLRLFLIGRDTTSGQLQREAEGLGVGHAVDFLGHRTDVLSLMAGADCIVLPSFSEGLPRGLCEAMMLGLPIAASETCRHVLGGGEHGEIFTPDSPEQYAEAVDRALARTSQQLQQAKRWAEQTCDPDRQIQTTLRVYQQAVSI